MYYYSTGSKNVNTFLPKKFDFFRLQISTQKQSQHRMFFALARAFALLSCAGARIFLFAGQKNLPGGAADVVRGFRVFLPHPAAGQIFLGRTPLNGRAVFLDCFPAV